jgi:hypothetical protein
MSQLDFVVFVKFVQLILMAFFSAAALLCLFSAPVGRLFNYYFLNNGVTAGGAAAEIVFAAGAVNVFDAIEQFNVGKGLLK